MGRMSDAAFGDDLFTPKPVTGRELRDGGIRRVAENGEEWMRAALGFIHRLPAGWVGTSEDIKKLAIPQIGAPHHLNCWGAMTNTAVRRGLLIKTGRWCQTKGSASHARNVQEYRRP